MKLSYANFFYILRSCYIIFIRRNSFIVQCSLCYLILWFLTTMRMIISTTKISRFTTIYSILGNLLTVLHAVHCKHLKEDTLSTKHKNVCPNVFVFFLEVSLLTVPVQPTKFTLKSYIQGYFCQYSETCL